MDILRLLRTCTPADDEVSDDPPQPALQQDGTHHPFQGDVFEISSDTPTEVADSSPLLKDAMGVPDPQTAAALQQQLR
eukprot:7427492-Prorocentrum_lima.AAC.1